MLVAQLAQALQALRRHRADAALALHRLDQDAGRFGADGMFERLMVAEGQLVEAFDPGAEALEIFRLAAGGNGGQRAAMEGALEGDEAVAFRVAVGGMILARHLDGALQRLGTGIGEEHRVGEARIDQPLGQPLLPRHLVKVGCVPDLPRLFGEGFHQVRVGMAAARHRHARTEIKIGLALGGEHAHALAAVEGHLRAGISRQNGRDHGGTLLSKSKGARRVGRAPRNKNLIIPRPRGVNHALALNDSRNSRRDSQLSTLSQNSAGTDDSCH